jgi:hypothetical protein
MVKKTDRKCPSYQNRLTENPPLKSRILFFIKIFYRMSYFFLPDSGLILKKARIHVSTNCIRRDFHVHQ